MLANRSSNLAIHPCHLANHPSDFIHPPSPNWFNIAIIATSSPSLSLSSLCVAGGANSNDLLTYSCGSSGSKRNRVTKEITEPLRKQFQENHATSLLTCLKWLWSRLLVYSGVFAELSDPCEGTQCPSIYRIIALHFLPGKQEISTSVHC